MCGMQIKPGDLVSIYYESRRYYIIMEVLDPKREQGGEQKYLLLGLKDGIERVARYSDINIINRA